jgi:hypothetical protein
MQREPHTSFTQLFFDLVYEFAAIEPRIALSTALFLPELPAALSPEKTVLVRH